MVVLRSWGGPQQAQALALADREQLQAAAEAVVLQELQQGLHQLAVGVGGQAHVHRAGVAGGLWCGVGVAAMVSSVWRVGPW